MVNICEMRMRVYVIYLDLWTSSSWLQNANVINVNTHRFNNTS